MGGHAPCMGVGNYAWAFVVLALGCLMATALVPPHADT
jgi:hypothetical protein